MTARRKLNDLTARHVTVDRVYAGILPNNRCICGDLALDHEARLLRTHRFAIKCVIPHCHCTTFFVPADHPTDPAANPTTNQKDEHHAT